MRGKVLSRDKRVLMLAVGASLLVHGAVGSALWNRAVPQAQTVEILRAIQVELVNEPRAAGPAGQAGGGAQGKTDEDKASEADATAIVSSEVEAAIAPQSSVTPVSKPTLRKPRTAPDNIETVNLDVADNVPPMRLLGAAEMANASRAGSASGGGIGAGTGAGDGAGQGAGGVGSGSGGGGACDMAGRLQNMLRRDARAQVTVRNAQRVLEAGSRAMHVWDGDWVQSTGQSGRGLAGLRQAIAVEVAFAPRECRTAPMRGLVILSLGDAPHDPRIALGAEMWRWDQLSKR